MNVTFQTPGPTALDVWIPAGDVSIQAEATDRTEVEIEPFDESDPAAPLVEARESAGRFEVLVHARDRHRGLGFFRKQEYDVRIRCPEDTDASVETASADVRARGPMGRMDARTASGDVRLDRVTGARVAAASGDLEVEYAGDIVEVSSASGDVTIGHAAGSVRANLASGDLRIRSVEGDVDANTASGDQMLEAVGPGSVRLETLSGNVEVGVRPGLDVWMDLQSLSGETGSDLAAADPPGDHAAAVVEVRVRSMSGDIRIRRAAATAASASPPEAHRPT